VNFIRDLLLVRLARTPSHHNILTLQSFIITKTISPPPPACPVAALQASTVQAFVVPGLIGLALVAGKHLTSKFEGSAKGSSVQRLMALLVLALGVALFGNGILQRVLA
jgi:small neutral amino acid transporter SnatA (MarC family)